MIALRRSELQRMRRVLLAALPAAALLPFCSPVLAADDAMFQYRGREYTPTGSSMSRRLAWSGKLPFDKTYADLTPAQQAYVRDQYDGLKAQEEPPFPRDGLRDVLRRVDEKVSQDTPRLEPGPLLVVASVDAEGKVQKVKIYKEPNVFASNAVSQALLATPFKPATRDGAPIDMDFLFSIDLL